MRIIVGSSLIVFACCAAVAQTAPARLSFEAASLKQTASPGTMERMMRSMSGGPGSTDPGRFTYTNVTLKLLIEMAYNLKDFQVEGPAWIDSEGFDLIATMAQGTTKEQAAEMMQTLLAERFKLEFHRETKPMPMFALVVGKSGPKLKEAETPAPMPDGPPPAPGAGPGGMGRGPNGMGRGPNGMGRGPGVRMMMSPNGIRLTGQMTTEQLAGALTRQLARPVLDQTELHKTYDVDISWMPDGMEGGRMPVGGGPGPGGPGPGGPEGPGREGGRNGGAEQAISLAQALQDDLGLKLDPRKAPAEVLIIDRAEKAPVEN